MLSVVKSQGSGWAGRKSEWPGLGKEWSTAHVLSEVLGMVVCPLTSGPHHSRRKALLIGTVACYSNDRVTLGSRSFRTQCEHIPTEQTTTC